MLIEFSKTKDDAALAVGLVNTWDTLARDPELLRDRAALAELLRFDGQERLAGRVSTRTSPVSSSFAACGVH